MAYFLIILRIIQKMIYNFNICSFERKISDDTMTWDSEFDYYCNFEFHCKDEEKFKKIIGELYDGNSSNLKAYIENDGTISDCCFMCHRGNGDVSCESLCKASIIGGSLDGIKILVENESSLVNSGDSEHHILSLAITHEQNEITQYLLNHGASPNSRGFRCKTPLYYALVNTDVKLVEQLIDLGANSTFHVTFGRSRMNILDSCLDRMTTCDGEKYDNYLKISKLLVKAGCVATDKETNKEDALTIKQNW